MLRSVIFDLDDTLYPEREYVVSGFHTVADWCASHLSVDSAKVFDQLLEMFDQGTRGDLFDRLVDLLGASRETVPEMVDLYRSHRPTIRPYQGVVELLASLSTNYQLGVVTDGNPVAQRRKVEALSVERYLDAIVYSDDLGVAHRKPSRRPFELALQLLGNTPSESAYIGENCLKDFRGAKEVGILTIRVKEPAGFYTHFDPPSPDHAPDVELTSLGELERFLSEHGGVD